jgi:D-inositol-3-phosphate glycosyltransferase
MHILFVLDYYHPHIGGGELIFQRLAEGLVERGHTVKVIASNNIKELPKIESLNGVEIERISVPRSGERFFFSILGARSVLRNARQVDIVHTSAYGGALTAFLAARLAGRPILFTIHEVLGKLWRQVEGNPIKAFSYQLIEWVITSLPYDYWVAVSDATLKDAWRIRIDKNKSIRIYNGVDSLEDSPVQRSGILRKVIDSEKNDFIYLFFGRPGITKGLKYLVHAVPEIQKVIPSSRLVLILSDQPRDQYRRICEEITKEQRFARVDILPAIKNKHDLYQYLVDANCIVIPSITEGFGLSAAEACNLRIPVVTTRAGSLPEVVSGSHLFVESGSSNALAQAIIRVNHQDWDETPLKTFSWVDTIINYETVYKMLLETHIGK